MGLIGIFQRNKENKGCRKQTKLCVIIAVSKINGSMGLDNKQESHENKIKQEENKGTKEIVDCCSNL